MLLLREEKFAILPVADGTTAALNPTMAVFGNNKTATFDTDGGIILTAYVNGQSAQTAILGASADTDNPFAVGLLTDDSPAFRAVIRTGASIADVALYAGMRQTNVVATGTDDDAYGFRCETGRKHTVTVTPANVQIGDVFSILIDGTVVCSITATAATVANVTDRLHTAFHASGAIALYDAVDGGTVLTLTAKAAGASHIITGTAVNGGNADTQTITIATTQEGTTATWKLLLSKAGSDYEFDTGVAVVAATVYDLQLSLDSERRVTAFINGRRVCQGAKLLQLTTAVVMFPVVGAQQSTGITATKGVTVYEVACGVEL